MEHSKNDIWVGLFVMLALAALVFLALQSANLLSLSWQPTYRITARFDNIGGLKPKAAVKSAGVVVGRVASVSFDDDLYRASVAVDMDARAFDPGGYLTYLHVHDLLYVYSLIQRYHLSNAYARKCIFLSRKHAKK